MQKIYSSATLADAHLVVGLLGQAGIEAKVLNENAQGGLGEIPFTHAWPEIWIVHASDKEQALEVIRDIERPGTNTQVACAACKEMSPDNFELCWNCGEAIGS
jgi:hypothetical protein